MTEITCVHVVGPLGEAKCPTTGCPGNQEDETVREAGSWDWGPFYWLCEICGQQWGHA